MTENAAIRELDDATVLRIVSYLTERLRDEIPDQEQGTIQSAEEARSAVAAFLDHNGMPAPASPEVVSDEGLAAKQGRALLQVFWDDESLRPEVEALIANPPVDSQKAVVELALATAIILGGLVTWLQTKIEIDVVRKDGKTDFRFKLRKDKTNDELIEKVVAPVNKIVLSG